MINRFPENNEPLLVVRKRLLEFLCDLADILFPHLLLVCKYSALHLLRRNDLLDLRKHLLGDRATCIFMLCLANLCHNLVDKCDDRLIDLVALVDSLNHLVLRHLVRASLNHNHLLACGCHCELQIAVLPLLLIRVDHKLSIDKSHLCRRTRSIKRNIRYRSNNRGANHCYQLRTALRIDTHHHIIQGDIISVILWKQRAHRPVNHAACEDRVLARLAFPLIKTARNLTHRIELLLVLNGEREEINTVTRLVRCRCCTQHGRVAIMHQRRPVCLRCHSSDINCQCASCKLHAVCLVGLILFLTKCHVFHTILLFLFSL